MVRVWQEEGRETGREKTGSRGLGKMVAITGKGQRHKSRQFLQSLDLEFAF